MAGIATAPAPTAFGGNKPSQKTAIASLLPLKPLKGHQALLKKNDYSIFNSFALLHYG